MNRADTTRQLPRYQGQGWTHWPENPQWSLQYLRILGTAQEGAASVSECFQVASRITAGDQESWYREWSRIAEVNAERGMSSLAAGRSQTAAANFLRASSYYRTAEYFLEPRDSRRLTTFDKVVSHARRYLTLAYPSGECLSIDLGEGVTLDAYFIRPVGTSGRSPTVICFGGLDGCKEEMLPRVGRSALSRGLALLLVDMPGQGEGLRRRGLTHRADAETAIGRCIDVLSSRQDVDPNRLGVCGASLGGIYAARAASIERRLKAAVSDGLIFDLQSSLAQRLREDAQKGWELLQWAFGSETPEAVIDKAATFRMERFLGGIRCPYLIVQGEHDFLGLQTALDAVAFAKAQGVAVDLKIFTGAETGAAHCQSDNPTLGQEFICDWLLEQLQNRRAGAA